MIDNEPTLNKHARQAFKADALRERKAHVEARKKARVITVSRSAEPVVNEYRFEVTAYTAGYESTGKRPGDIGYGVTSSGEYVMEGVTVACPKSLAFGTRLYIEGVGYRVCHDLGGDITQGRLDVYIADLGQAQVFGRQTLKVRILRKGSE